MEIRTSSDYCVRVTVLLLATLINCTYASYDHSCYLEDYLTAGSRNTQLCGRVLTRFITQSCPTRPENPEWFNLRSTRSVPEVNGVFISSASANSILEHDSEHNPRVGLVCECCVHRCSVNEIREYCSAPQKDNSSPRRRRRRSLTFKSESSYQTEMSSITQHDLDQLYSLLDEMKPFAELFKEEPTADEKTLIHTLDKIKLQAVRENQQQTELAADAEEKAPKLNHHHHRRHHKDRSQKRG